MKFLAGLAVAASLASSAAAASAAASAPVYLLRSASPSTSPSSTESTDASSLELPRQIVRQILLARLDANSGSSFFDMLPRNFDPETALDLVQQFGGKTSSPLLDATSQKPHQLLVVVQGAQPEHVAALEAALPTNFAKPAFSVADPPSEVANTHLFIDELSGEGVQAQVDASVADAVAAGMPESWAKGVFVGLYDAKKVGTSLRGATDFFDLLFLFFLS